MDKPNARLRSALKFYGSAYIKYLQAELKNAKPFSKIDTGALYNSLNSKIEQINNELELVITGKEYIKAIDEGQEPGTEVSLEKLVPWVQRRLGYSGKKAEQVGWLVQRKIKRFGTDPYNVIDKAKVKLLADKNLLKGISTAARLDLLDYLDKSLQDVAQKYGFKTQKEP
jgi:hypothetical protein